MPRTKTPDWMPDNDAFAFRYSFDGTHGRAEWSPAHSMGFASVCAPMTEQEHTRVTKAIRVITAIMRAAGKNG